MRKMTWVLTLILWAVICAFTAQKFFEIKMSAKIKEVTECTLAKQQARQEGYNIGLKQGAVTFQLALIQAVKEGKVTYIEIIMSEEETVMFKKEIN